MAAEAMTGADRKAQALGVARRPADGAGRHGRRGGRPGGRASTRAASATVRSWSCAARATTAATDSSRPAGSAHLGLAVLVVFVAAGGQAGHP